MASSRDVSVTRISLIESLKDDRQEAWDDFYALYSPLIISFAMKRGCCREMAQDVMQETTLSLVKHLDEFTYDTSRGRFKSLLFKIAESKVVDLFRRSQKLDKLKSSELFKVDAEGEEKASPETEELWEREWRENLLRQSIECAKRRVKPKTFACFEETFLNGKSVADVAGKLGISGNLVSQHKFKVFKTILDAAQELLSFKEF